MKRSDFGMYFHQKSKKAISSAQKSNLEVKILDEKLTPPIVIKYIY